MELAVWSAPAQILRSLSEIGHLVESGVCMGKEQMLPGTRIANLQKMAVAERREAEPTTRRRNELGLAVRQATIELLAESCRQ